MGERPFQPGIGATTANQFVAESLYLQEQARLKRQRDEEQRQAALRQDQERRAAEQQRQEWLRKQEQAVALQREREQAAARQRQAEYAQAASRQQLHVAAHAKKQDLPGHVNFNLDQAPLHFRWELNQQGRWSKNRYGDANQYFPNCPAPPEFQKMWMVVAREWRWIHIPWNARLDWQYGAPHNQEYRLPPDGKIICHRPCGSPAFRG